MTELLTVAQLRAIMPDSPAEAWAKPLADACARWGILGAPARAAFLAVCGEETGQFHKHRERLNYGAERLAVVWPGRFSATGRKGGPPNDKARALAAAGEEAIANEVYASRLGNGAPETGDGWAFRGGCAIQITFHDNWLAAAKAHTVADTARPALRAWAELASVDRTLNASCSAWFFAAYAKLLPLASSGNQTDFLAAAHRVGLPPDQRVVDLWLALWRRALAVLDGTETGTPPRLDRELVKRVQDALNANGALPVLLVDGIWGPRSEAAGDRFREDAGLPQGDGPTADLVKALGLAA